MEGEESLAQSNIIRKIDDPIISVWKRLKLTKELDFSNHDSGPLLFLLSSKGFVLKYDQSYVHLKPDSNIWKLQVLMIDLTK